MRSWLALIVVGLLLGSCADNESAPDTAGAPTTAAPLASATSEATGSDPSPTSPIDPWAPEFGEATVVLHGSEGPVSLEVEVAETDEQRGYGLMFRESLPEESGMVFLFPEDNFSAFYMKNTLIPLSIAFFDKDGKILSILDMEPCKKDPCKLYDPFVAYRGALEVNQGMFEEWGVEVGDVVEIEGE